MVERVECPVCHNNVGTTRRGRIVKHTPCDEVRYGRPPIDPYDRAMRHVQRKGRHLLWTGWLMNGVPALQVRQAGRSRTPTGGGRTSVTVRRVVWRKHHGDPPEGAVIIVTCREPTCVAVGHLKAVGQAQEPLREERRRRRAELAEARARRDAAIVEDYRAGVLVETIKAKHGIESPVVYRAIRGAGLTPDRGGGRYPRTGRVVARDSDRASPPDQPSPQTRAPRGRRSDHRRRVRSGSGGSRT